MPSTGTLRPTGNGFYTEWDVSNFTNVDEVTADDDTTFDFWSKTLDVAGERVAYLVDNSSVPEGATIDSIQVTWRWRKVGGGPSGETNPFVRVGAVDYHGTETAAGVTYQTDVQTITVGAAKAAVQIGVREGATNKDLRLTQISCVINYTESGVISSPGTGALSAAGRIAVLALGVSLGLGSLALTGAAPVAVVSQSAAPATGSVAIAGLTPALRFGAVMPAGTVVAAGRSISLGGAIGPPRGALGVSGAAATGPVDDPTPVGRGAVALTGAAPTALVPVILSPASGPIIAAGQYIGLAFAGPDVGAVALLGRVPLLALRMSPPTVAVQATGRTPGLASQIPIPAGALQATGRAPTTVVGASAVAQPATGAAVLTGAIPIRLIDTPRAAPAGSLRVTGSSPALASRMSLPTGALAATGQLPNLLAAVIAQPGAGALVLTGAVPNIQAPVVVVPSVGALSLTGQYQGVAFLGPTFGAIALTGIAPSMPPIIPTQALVLTGQPFTLRFKGPEIGPLALTGYIPTIPLRQPSVGPLVAQGRAPLLALRILCPIGTVALTGQTPSLVIGAGGTTLAPGVGSTAVTGRLASLARRIPPPVGALQATGRTPTLARTVAPGRGLLALTGIAPSLRIVMMPATGTATLTGRAPTATLALMRPLAGAVTVSGVPPSILIESWERALFSLAAGRQATFSLTIVRSAASTFMIVRQTSFMLER